MTGLGEQRGLECISGVPRRGKAGPAVGRGRHLGRKDVMQTSGCVWLWLGGGVANRRVSFLD